MKHKHSNSESSCNSTLFDITKYVSFLTEWEPYSFQIPNVYEDIAPFYSKWSGFMEDIVGVHFTRDTSKLERYAVATTCKMIIRERYSTEFVLFRH